MGTRVRIIRSIMPSVRIALSIKKSKQPQFSGRRQHSGVAGIEGQLQEDGGPYLFLSVPIIKIRTSSGKNVAKNGLTMFTNL